MSAELLPVEDMALTIAKAHAERGDSVPPNTAQVLIWAIERLTGRFNWALLKDSCPECGEPPDHHLVVCSHVN